MDISSNIDQLVAQVEQLDDRSLETFLNFAPDKIQRIQILQKRLQEGQILEVEHKELHKLLLQSSRHDIARLKLLLEFSKLRNVTVPELMANRNTQ